MTARAGATSRCASTSRTTTSSSTPGTDRRRVHLGPMTTGVDLGAVRHTVTTDGSQLVDDACHDGSCHGHSDGRRCYRPQISPFDGPRSTRDQIDHDRRRLDRSSTMVDHSMPARRRGARSGHNLGDRFITHTGPSAARGRQRFLVLSSRGVDWQHSIRQHRRPELIRGATVAAADTVESSGSSTGCHGALGVSCSRSRRWVAGLSASRSASRRGRCRRAPTRWPSSRRCVRPLGGSTPPIGSS